MSSPRGRELVRFLERQAIATGSSFTRAAVLELLLLAFLVSFNSPIEPKTEGVRNVIFCQKVKSFAALGFWLLAAPLASAQDQDAVAIISQFDRAVAMEDGQAISALANEIANSQDELGRFLTADELADLLAQAASELAALGENEAAAALMREAIEMNRSLADQLTSDEEVFTTLDEYAAREALYDRLWGAYLLLQSLGYTAEAEEFRAEAVSLLEDHLAPGEINLLTMGASPLGADGGGEPFQVVQVFYGTNRAVESDDPNRAYSNERAPLTYGTIDVSVPTNRTPGSIPRPRLGGEREGLHIVLRSINRLGDAGFGGRLRRSIDDAASDREEVFIFVHGHAVRFDQAARQTAQLAVDLDIRDGAIMYSWPNGESVGSYQISQASVGISSRRYAEFLETVMAEVGDADIHLIAHSMGNRLLLNALDRLYDPDVEEPMFSHIFWASADVDADLFEATLSDLSGVAAGMTAYTSARDRALQVSSSLSGGNVRAGQSEPLPNVAELITAVDTTQLSQGLTGHGDFADALIEDMQSIVWLSLPPEGRCILVPTELEGGSRFWRAVDDRPECDKDAFGRALWATRNFGDDAQAEIRSALQDGRITDQSREPWERALMLMQGFGD